MKKRFDELLAIGGRSLVMATALAWLLTGCSPSTDEGWPPEDEATPQAEELTPAEPEELVEAEESPLAGHAVEDIEAVREFSDDLLTDLMQSSIACDLLSAEQLGEVVGGEWADGIFRWFETEVNLAPGALKGICVWQDIEHRTNINLRVYDDSDVAWTVLEDHYEAMSDRIYERGLGDGPERFPESFRQPHGVQGYNGTCARLDRHIACLTAPPRHAAEWDDIDHLLLEIIADALNDSLK